MAPNIFYWGKTKGYSKDCLFIAYKEESRFLWWKTEAIKTMFFPEDDEDDKKKLPEDIKKNFKSLKDLLDPSSKSIKSMELWPFKGKEPLPSPYSLESRIDDSLSEQGKNDIMPMVPSVVGLSLDQRKQDITSIMQGFLNKQVEFDINGWSDWLNLKYKRINMAFSVFKNLLKVATATILLACGAAIDPMLSLVLMDVLCGYTDGFLSITSAAISGINVSNYILRLKGLGYDCEKDFLSVLEEAIKEVSRDGKTQIDEKDEDEDEKGISKELKDLRKRRNLKRTLKRKLKSLSLSGKEPEDLEAAIQDEKIKESKLSTFIDEKLKDAPDDKLADAPQSVPLSQSDSKKISSKKSFAEKWQEWKEKWKVRTWLLISTSLSAFSYVMRMSLYLVKPLITKYVGLSAAATAVNIFSASCIALTAISVLITLYVSIKRFRRILKGEEEVEKVKGQERGLTFHDEIRNKYKKEWKELSSSERFREGRKAFAKYGTRGEIIGALGGVTSIVFMSLILAGIMSTGLGIFFVLATSVVAAACSRTYYLSYMKNVNRGQESNKDEKTKKDGKPLAPKETNSQPQAKMLPQQAVVNQPPIAQSQEQKQLPRLSIPQGESRSPSLSLCSPRISLDSLDSPRSSAESQATVGSQPDKPTAQSQKQTETCKSPEQTPIVQPKPLPLSLFSFFARSSKKLDSSKELDSRSPTPPSSLLSARFSHF